MSERISQFESGMDHGRNAAIINRATMGGDAHPSLDLYSAGGVDGLPMSASRGRTLSVRGILRYKKTIIYVSILTLIAAEAAVWTLMVPAYRATALIEVQPIIPRLLDETEDTGPLPFYQQYLATQADFATSNAVLNRVLDRSEIKKTNWYQGVPATPLARFQSKSPPLDRLRAELTVDVPKYKQILQIAHECAFRGEAKKLVEAVADEYTKYVTETRYQQDSESLQSLTKMRGDTKSELEGLEAQEAALKNNPELQSPDLETLISARKQTLEVLKTSLNSLDLEIQIVEKDLKDVSGGKNDGEGSAAAGSNFEIDGKWRKISDEIRAAQAELADKKSQFGERHRLVTSIHRQIERLEKQRTEREKQLEAGAAPDREPVHAAALSSPLSPRDPLFLSQRLSELQARRAATAREIQSKSDSFNATWRLYQDFSKARGLVKDRREVLARIEQRIFEIEQLRKAPAHIRRIGEAFEPDEPDTDKRPKMALAGLFGAIAAGAGAGFLRYRLSPKVYELTEVDLGPSPVLGHMLLIGDEELKSNPAAIGNRMESVRSIRTSLMPMLGTATGRTLQITSAGSGTGKTTFTLMLAKSFASCGKRVLVVDADMRRASLSRRMNQGEAIGLADMLKDTSLMHDQVRFKTKSGLHLITAGRGKDSQASELLANGVLGGRLEEWRNAYDLILLDSSPILPIADGSMLAQQVDGSIVLIREGHCDRTIVSKALAQIAAVGGRLTGIVFVSSGNRSDYSAYSEKEAALAK
ncbi:MAG: AAA family ATPase [Planctomycetia bacterium]|nr:AAA family ATPase [Planctomycetia bacterium]OQZ05622.1 MAG: hypothetical protein B6D36_09190 [Planctomycetes bacterium UTPLA1]